MAVFLAAAGCGGDARPGSAEVVTAPLAPGRVVAAAPVACFATADWQVEDDAWRFRGIADLVCHLAERPAGPLVFRLVPAADSRGRGFRVSWDGRPLAATSAAPETWEVAVAPALAAPGRHVLSVERTLGPGDDEARGAFARLAWTAPGPGGGELSADHRRPDAFVADFLLHGVAGRGTRFAGGVLFTGPGAVEIELPPGARRLLAEPVHASPTLARFAAAAGGAEAVAQVVPGGRGELALELPPGARRVRLEVSGAAGGAYLWGGLRVERRAERGEAPAGPPIVVVSLDTTRRDALGAYGGGPTPRLDAFAAGATVSTRAASTTSWTLPAHGSLLTGLFPSRHGAGVRDRSLGGASPETAPPTLAELLAGAGYLSAAVTGGHLVSHRFGIGRGFTWFHDPDGFASRGGRVTSLAEAEIDRLAAGGGPFLLFVHYFDAHFPYAAPLAFRRRAGEPEAARALAGLDLWPAAAAGDVDAWRGLLDRPGPVPPAARRWLEAAYRAEVASLDAEVGRLLDALDRRGLLDPALVVVTADHGELLGEGDRLSHGFGLEPELVEVPLLVKWPGQRRGRRDGSLVSLVDLFPTLLAAAGVAAPPVDGRPLVASGAEAAAGGGRARLLFEEHESLVHPLTFGRLWIADHLYGVASRRDRRVVWEDGGACAERAEGAAGGGGWRRAGCPEDGAALLARLREALGAVESAAPAAAGEMSDEERARLRALGYL